MQGRGSMILEFKLYFTGKRREEQQQEGKLDTYTKKKHPVYISFIDCDNK